MLESGGQRLPELNGLQVSFFFFFSDKLNDFFKNITLLPDSHIALRSLGVNFKMHKYFSILASSLERQSDVLGEHRLTSNSQPQFQSSLSVICSASVSPTAETVSDLTHMHTVGRLHRATSVLLLLAVIPQLSAAMG